MDKYYKYCLALVIAICISSCVGNRAAWNDLNGNPPDDEELQLALKYCDFGKKMRASKLHLEQYYNEVGGKIGFHRCWPRNLKSSSKFEEIECEDNDCWDKKKSEEYQIEACSCMMDHGFLQGYKVDTDSLNLTR